MRLPQRDTLDVWFFPVRTSRKKGKKEGTMFGGLRRVWMCLNAINTHPLVSICSLIMHDPLWGLNKSFEEALWKSVNFRLTIQNLNSDKNCKPVRTNHSNPVVLRLGFSIKTRLAVSGQWVLESIRTNLYSFLASVENFRKFGKLRRGHIHLVDLNLSSSFGNFQGQKLNEQPIRPCSFRVKLREHFWSQ